MRVRWTRTALANLDALAEYIARDDPGAAAQVVQSIVDATSLLSEHPAIGRPGRVPGTRELVVTNTPFLIPYRVRDKTVEILRVFHGARRWPTEF